MFGQKKNDDLENMVNKGVTEKDRSWLSGVFEKGKNLATKYAIIPLAAGTIALSGALSSCMIKPVEKWAYYPVEVPGNTVTLTMKDNKNTLNEILSSTGPFGSIPTDSSYGDDQGMELTLNGIKYTALEVGNDLRMLKEKGKLSGFQEYLANDGKYHFAVNYLGNEKDKSYIADFIISGSSIVTIPQQFAPSEKISVGFGVQLLRELYADKNGIKDLNGYEKIIQTSLEKNTSDHNYAVSVFNKSNLANKSSVLKGNEFTLNYGNRNETYSLKKD